tara:strand:+ start:57 stop:188 length:132 start_codon:yes stop_codon:yes gene_type:complete
LLVQVVVMVVLMPVVVVEQAVVVELVISQYQIHRHKVKHFILE